MVKMYIRYPLSLRLVEDLLFERGIDICHETVRMARSRNIKTMQKFASVHASIHNHFHFDYHLTNRDAFKKVRSAALAE